jgi:predicted adenine nucleotide alpha hydrolase (AANH) superfamily ATPase
MVEEMRSSSAIQEVVVFFQQSQHSPPEGQYEIRKTENKLWCQRIGVSFVDADYDVENWYARTRGWNSTPNEVDGVPNVSICAWNELPSMHTNMAFMPLQQRTPHRDGKMPSKSMQVEKRAAARYPSLQYWAHDWQSDEMTMRKYQISVMERFYKQEYCGCSYSLRDSNDWRKANGIPKIQIGGDTAGLGDRHFSDPIVDAQAGTGRVWLMNSLRKPRK